MKFSLSCGFWAIHRTWSIQPKSLLPPSGLLLFPHISIDLHQIPLLHLSSSSLSLLFKLLCAVWLYLLRSLPSLSLLCFSLFHPPKSRHSSSPLLPHRSISRIPVCPLLLLFLCTILAKSSFHPYPPTLPLCSLSSPVILFLLLLSSLTSMASGGWVKHCMTEHTGSLAYLAAG